MGGGTGDGGGGRMVCVRGGCVCMLGVGGVIRREAIMIINKGVYNSKIPLKHCFI